MRSRGFLRGPMAKRIAHIADTVIGDYMRRAPNEELVRLTRGAFATEEEFENYIATAHPDLRETWERMKADEPDNAATAA